MGLRNAFDSVRGPAASRRDVLSSLAAVPLIGPWMTDGEIESERVLPELGHGTTDERANFGSALALDGATALVGATGGPGIDAPSSGAAFLYTRTGGIWSTTATFESPANGHWFGSAVDLDGPIAVVGDPGASGGTVTVFERTDDNWERTTTLNPPEPSGIDHFGETVALDGNTVVVGAPGTSTSESREAGAASVFTRLDGQWRQTRLEPDASVRRFGTAVDVEGDTAVVGGLDRDATDGRGFALIFRRSGSDWTRTARVTLDDAVGIGFGTTLSLSDGTLLVGAPGETTAGGYRAGTAALFSRAGGRWRQTATLRPPDSGSDDRFGRAVALDGDTAIVVAAGIRDRIGTATDKPAGAAHLFQRTLGRWRWEATRATGGSDPPRRGTTAAIGTAGALVAGHPVEDPTGEQAGTVRVIDR